MDADLARLGSSAFLHTNVGDGDLERCARPESLYVLRELAKDLCHAQHTPDRA